MAHIDPRKIKTEPLSVEELQDFIRRFNEFEQESQKADFVINAPAVPFQPDPCKACGNNPVNGGSGICFCTLGSPKVTF